MDEDGGKMGIEMVIRALGGSMYTFLRRFDNFRILFFFF